MVTEWRGQSGLHDPIGVWGWARASGKQEAGGPRLNPCSPNELDGPRPYGVGTPASDPQNDDVWGPNPPGAHRPEMNQNRPQITKKQCHTPSDARPVLGYVARFAIQRTQLHTKGLRHTPRPTLWPRPSLAPPLLAVPSRVPWGHGQARGSKNEEKLLCYPEERFWPILGAGALL